MFYTFKEDTNKWNDSTGSRVERLNIIKKSILPKSVYRFNATKILTVFFAEIKKFILNFIWNSRDPNEKEET